MSIYENIEKVYRVKGYKDVFRTSKEAENYATKVLAEESIATIRRAKIFCEEYIRRIEECRILAEEARWNIDAIGKYWSVEKDFNGMCIKSKSTRGKVPIAFDIDLKTKKGLRFAREVVRFYCKAKIKLLQEQIRFQKNVIKKEQRDYSKLKGEK